MESNGFSGSEWAGVNPMIFVLDAATEPVEDWLCQAGTSLPVRGADAAELPGRLSGHLREGGEQPLLAVVMAAELDEELLSSCRRLQRLGEQGRLGLVLVVTGPAPDAGGVEAALAVGCIDVVATGGRRPGDGLMPRLVLVAGLLRERHLRHSRERLFRSQLSERRVMEARLNYVATHDELTDLANRRALEKALDEAITEGARRGFTNALLYLDLDRFKLHNDAAGHGSGDRLLKVVGNVLRGALPPEHLLARLGSDEFAVLLGGSDEREAHHTAERLRAAVAAIEPDGDRIAYHVGISIGLTTMPPGAVSGASQALAQAEQACFVAKSSGGNAVRAFDAGDEALVQMREDMCLARPLRRALKENRFFLVFQPILSTSERRVSHFEALIRLPAGVGGDGRSAAFMLAAERLGLAQQIDLWVVAHAIGVLARHPEVSLAVNLSSHAFQEPNLLPLVSARLEATGVAPQRLVFEITETAAVMNFAQTRRMIAGLRALGCRFALDDFGSGFSSYNYLKQFPVDTLKIDGSFVVGVRQDRRDQAIVQSMVDIGHSLGKGVVAEFIEDATTFALLVDMGIDYAQGYFVGRPVSAPVAVGALCDQEEGQ